MKKSLIALAALAAVSAASAQSSVTLYGLLDIGYGSQSTKSRDGTLTVRSRGVMDGANAGSRIGFRGTEDLGGGLKANFVFEQGVSPTSANGFANRLSFGQPIPGFGSAATGLSGSGGGFSANTNRQSYVGLSSTSMGTLNIGYQYTNLYELATLSGYTISSEGMPGGDKAHLFGLLTVGSARANGLTYISPSFSGFTVRAQYGASGFGSALESQQTGASNLTSSGKRFGLMGQYANGPLSVALAYTTLTSQGNASAFAVPTVPVNAADRKSNITQLGASYDFGVAKVGGTYLRAKNGGVSTSMTLNNSYRAYQIGVSVPFGAFVPFIAIGRAKNTENSLNTVAEDFKTAQIGVRYSLSKRTTAYAMYGKTTDAAAPANPLAYSSDTKTIVGVSHSF